ncbi:MAG: hypothetical protein WC473_06045 [Patescibacteria group bacterium]
MGSSFRQQFTEIASGVRVDIDESAFKKEIENLGKIYDQFDKQVESDPTKIKADSKQAINEAGNAEKAVKKVPAEKKTIFSGNARPLTDTIASVGIALGTVTMTVKKVIGVISDWTKASNIQEQADTRLINTLKNKGIYTDSYYLKLKDMASAIQKVTTVGDEQSEMLMGLAVNMGVATDKVIETTTGAIGLATSFKEAGLSQELALKGIALAYEGNFTQLQRYIPELRSAKDETEKMAILQRNMADGYKLAQQAAQDGAGAIEQYKNLVGDLKEGLGNLVKIALVPAVKFMSNFAAGLANVLDFGKKTVSNLDQQKKYASDLQYQFDDLTQTLLYLAQKEKLSNEELKIKNDTIAKLQSEFPNYFSNLKKEADNYETLKTAVANARIQLENYTNQLIQQAIVQQYADQIAELTTKIVQNKTTIAELEIANDKLKNSFATDTQEIIGNRIAIENHNTMIKAAQNANIELEKRLNGVKSSLILAKEEAKKYTSALAPKPVVEFTEVTEEQIAAIEKAKNAWEEFTKQYEQSKLTPTQKVTIEFEAQKANIAALFEAGTPEYKTAVQKLNEWYESEMAGARNTENAAEQAKYDKLREMNQLFLDNKLISQEEAATNEYNILQDAYNNAVKLYGAESEAALAARKKVLDFERSATEEEIELNRKKVEQREEAINASMTILESYANFEQQKRQIEYQDNIKSLQNYIQNEQAKLDNQLKYKAISEDAYQAKVTALEKYEESQTAHYREESEKRSKIEKATAIAQATIATYEMATKAYKAMIGLGPIGPVLAAAAAAAAIAYGMKQVMLIKSTYKTGGIIKGPEQIINVNEEGEEFVVNAPATRVLGSKLLTKIMAFPVQTKEILQNVAYKTGGYIKGPEQRIIVNEEGEEFVMNAPATRVLGSKLLTKIMAFPVRTKEVLQNVAYKTGGMIKGKEQIINVNEEGEEFVMNAPATRVLGSKLLTKIMAFPVRTKEVLQNVSYKTGGIIKGKEQIINVNEEGEEFVINAPATRVLGSKLLTKIMAFPVRTKEVLQNVAFPEMNIPAPAYAFANGGSTINVQKRDNYETINNRLNIDLSAIKDRLKAIEDAILGLDLRAELDNEKLAIKVEKGNKILKIREIN